MLTAAFTPTGRISCVTSARNAAGRVEQTLGPEVAPLLETVSSTIAISLHRLAGAPCPIRTEEARFRAVFTVMVHPRAARPLVAVTVPVDSLASLPLSWL